MKVRTEDGWTLDIDVRANGNGRAVLLLHAMMVDRRSMDRPAGSGLASFFEQQGWDVYLADLRGHGKSGPLPKDGGAWTYDDFVYQDIPALSAAVKDVTDGPVWIVGHSLGAHTTAASIGQGKTEVDGLVMLSGNTWLPRLEPSRRRRLRKAANMVLFRAMTKLAGRFPARRLRMGPADEARPYVRDLTRFWFQDAWRSRDGADYLAGLATIDIPVLSVMGRGDVLMCHPVGGRNWALQMTEAQLEIWVVEAGSFGLDFDPDHMQPATDQRSLPLWRRIEAWMSETT